MNKIKVVAYGLLLATGISLGITDSAVAAPIIDRQIVIQPIQICTDGGSLCTNPDKKTYESAADKIWGQAGIDVKFLDFNQYNSSADRIVTYDELKTSCSPSGICQQSTFFQNAGGKNGDPDVINIWFGQTSTFGALGVANTFLPTSTNPHGMGANGIFINLATTIQDWITVISHEIGHNLGLEHYDNPYGQQPGPIFQDPYNLMATNTLSNISLDNLSPDGLGFGHLTQSQIDLARQSRFVQAYIPENVPAPLSVGLLLIGLAGLALVGRRRKDH